MKYNILISKKIFHIESDKGIFMNKKAMKAYNKAMDYYEKGKITRALEECEQVLSEGLDNPVVLNFKGLLLYQKGSLNEAVTVWKLNIDLNDNDIAKNYISDVVEDENRLELYKQGERALKQLKIESALELFLRCAESDFNSIKVNTGIAMCYQKKGDFYRAKEYVDKALRIDQNAITAKLIKKELVEQGIYMEASNLSKPLLIGVTIVFIIFSVSLGAFVVHSKFNEKNLTDNIKNVENNKVTEENSVGENTGSENEENTKVSNSITEEPNEKKFDREKVKTALAGNDLDVLYEQINGVDEQSVSTDDIELYKKAMDLIKKQGVPKFYENGLSYFTKSNYSDAKISFDKAYTYCEEINMFS